MLARLPGDGKKKTGVQPGDGRIKSLVFFAMYKTYKNEQKSAFCLHLRP